MAKKVNGNVKEWVKRNGDTIIACAMVVAVGVGGFILGDKYSQLAIAKGLEKFHDDGYLKFIDPLTNGEVTVEESIKLLKNKY